MSSAAIYMIIAQLAAVPHKCVKPPGRLLSPPNLSRNSKVSPEYSSSTTGYSVLNLAVQAFKIDGFTIVIIAARFKQLKNKFSFARQYR